MSDCAMSRRTELTILFNNTDISADINKAIINLTYTDQADGATDDLKITLADRDRVWTKDWLRKELENRAAANADIENGYYGEYGSETVSGEIYTVTTKVGLTVRSGPGTSYGKVGTLSYGTTVTVVGIVNGWAEISYSGERAYCSAQSLTKDQSGGKSWSIGDTVTVTGRGRRDSYGSSTIKSYDATGHQGKITHLNLRDGVPYPICVDSIGWFAENCVSKVGTVTEQDGSNTSNAKYTKISAVIAARNVDGMGSDSILPCGTFELDNVGISGPPNTVTLSATSLSYESAIRKTKKTRSWNSTTLKDIARTIAAAGGYECMYLSAYVPWYKYIVQNNLSDIAFLSDRATAAGILLKVTDGIIVLYDQQDALEQEPIKTVTYGDGSYTDYEFESSLAMTGYASCHVSYEDDSGNTYEATFTPETGFSEGEVLEISSEPVSSNAEALELAKRRLRAENKGEMTGRLKMTGDPQLQAGLNVEVSGWGDFDGKWTIEKAVHSVSNNGYTTDIDISKVVEGY